MYLHVCRFFSDRTHNALLHHPALCNEDVTDTAIFIEKVLTWWKIINVRAFGADIRHRDPLQKVIDSSTDVRLDTILEFGNMALKMGGPPGKRMKQLSKDTANAIHHTCHGLVELCKHLLATSHKYVLLGQFTTDFLEKEFSKLRQGSGGTAFINVQQIIEKLHIKQASLLLRLKVNIDDFQVQSGHQCSSCDYRLSEEASAVFDNLPDLENSIPEGSKSALLYIAGYCTRKDELEEEGLLGQTFFYCQKYGKFSDGLDRRGVKVPSDNSCQWVFFCHALFQAVKDEVCRKSLAILFLSVSDFYLFQMKNKHCIILSNIFLNNFCTTVTPRSGKEPALKILKLSS